MKQLFLLFAFAVSATAGATTRDDSKITDHIPTELKEKYNNYKKSAIAVKTTIASAFAKGLEDELFQFACFTSGTLIIAGAAEGCLVAALVLSAASSVPYIVKNLIKK